MKKTLAALLLSIALCASTAASAATVWLTNAEITALPTSGSAYQNVQTRANQAIGTPNVSNQDDNADINTLAHALLYVRSGAAHYKTEARDAIIAAIGTESDPPNNPNGIGNRTLAMGRNICSYVIAAQLIGLAPADTTLFNSWLRTCLTESMESNIHLNMITTHEQDPNNWGTVNGASRMAICSYLGLTAQMARCDSIFRGWAGDRTIYTGFQYDSDLSWQCGNGSAPVGINPLVCQNKSMGPDPDGWYIGGALPEEMRRGGSIAYPPGHTIYAWEGFSGVTVQCEILHRAGYNSYEYSNRAVLRAAQFLYNCDQTFGGWWAGGDDSWNPWLINYIYPRGQNGLFNFPAVTTGAQPGKIMGWTDWTHGPSGGAFMGSGEGANPNANPCTVP